VFYFREIVGEEEERDVRHEKGAKKRGGGKGAHESFG
jgi:hypothetical protein